MFLLNIQETQGIILGVVALIILVIVILSIRKWGWKSLIFWLIVGFIAYLLISDAVFG